MKLVYCIAGTYNSGGMERVLANKANYWVNNGHEVVIVTTDQLGRKPFFFLDNRIDCYDLNVNYERNNGKSFLNKLFHYPFKWIAHRKKLSILLNKLKADIVISMFCNDASFITGIHDGSKKVLEIHFSRLKRLQYGRKGMWLLADSLRTWMDARTVGMFDQFVVLTHEDKKLWGNLSNIAVIPNAISSIPSEVASLEKKNVLAVGRYTHQKGFDYLISAWSYVHSVQPEWMLNIIGEGELEEQLQQQINGTHLQNVVHLVPSTNQIEKFYAQASILAMSSRYEGLPMVLLEGLSFGLPIVSFACKCGPLDIVSDGENGFLVPEGNIKKLSDKLILLMKNDELRKRMGEEARKKVACFTEANVMNAWTILFEKLLNNK
ncbi:glycosyltransferase family 4 protein [uncultured Bacteroides sp.]|uniref:glycosyltransferase family 4 protein n=1 Tax=uncultured Bacteroides sp. TaxID=162156 RepID=UPI002AAB8F76|nr:glycosyltransferase family 4 protein [uncultured Bacteroides sp.]